MGPHKKIEDITLVDVLRDWLQTTSEWPPLCYPFVEQNVGKYGELDHPTIFLNHRVDAVNDIVAYTLVPVVTIMDDHVFLGPVSEHLKIEHDSRNYHDPKPPAYPDYPKLSATDPKFFDKVESHIRKRASKKRHKETRVWL